jgi:hypothetical protein
LFRRRVPTKQNQKANDFNYLYRPLNQLDRSLADEHAHLDAKAVHFDEPNPACADSLDGAQLLLDCASPFNLNRGDRSWAVAISIRENNARIAIRQDRRFEARPGQTALPKWISTAELKPSPAPAKFAGRCRSSMVKVAAATNRRRKNSFTWWDAATLTRALDPERVRDQFTASHSRGTVTIYWMNSPHF